MNNPVIAEPMDAGAVYLIDGKPHRPCKCDQMSPTCPRGVKRSEQTCGYGHCFLPVHDVLLATNTASSTERSWLIEMPAARWGTGFYWTGVAEYKEWGTIDKAVRFSRKADADAVIASLKERSPYERMELEACEHEWPAVGIASAIEAKETK